MAAFAKSVSEWQEAVHGNRLAKQHSPSPGGTMLSGLQSSCRCCRKSTRCQTLRTERDFVKNKHRTASLVLQIDSYHSPWLTARIFEWKFLVLFFFTMNSSMGSLAVRTLRSLALEKLNFCRADEAQAIGRNPKYLIALITRAAEKRVNDILIKKKNMWCLC